MVITPAEQHAFIGRLVWCLDRIGEVETDEECWKASREVARKIVLLIEWVRTAAPPGRAVQLPLTYLAFLRREL